MRRFVVRRALQAIPTFFGITLLVFLLVRLAPGDPLQMMVAGAADVRAEDVEALRRAHGLDQPYVIQYARWLGRALTGDLGQSLLYGRPVSGMIGAALPNTLQLSIAAMLVALLVGVPLGAAAARWRGTPIDHLVRIISVAGHAVPPFWFGLLFILTMAVQARLFPAGGMLSIGTSEWDVGDRLLHLVGPVLTLSLGGIANYSRYVRAELLDVLGQDLVRTARAKGLHERVVVWRHAARNALLPMITALGGLLAYLVSGAVVIEQVFAWPGMGRLTYEAARSKDYPIVMGVVVVSSLLLLTSYLLRDVAYAWADPRVRHG